MSGLSNGGFALLAGVMATLSAGDLYVVHQLQNLGTESDRLEQSIATELADVRQLTAAVNDDQHEDLEGLVAGLAQARAESETAVSETRRAAERYTARLARQVKAGQSRLIRTDEELASLRAQAAAARASADTLRRQVAEASADAAFHRAQAVGVRDAANIAAQTLEVLRTGVARNMDELATLREVGENVYIEFHLGRPGDMADMGGFRVMLKKLHPKARRYVLEVLGKHDHFAIPERGVEEPVRFYPPGATQMHEVVVTDAGWAGVAGYVVVPRVAALASTRYSRGKAETRSFAPGR